MEWWYSLTDEEQKLYKQFHFPKKYVLNMRDIETIYKKEQQYETSR